MFVIRFGRGDGIACSRMQTAKEPQLSPQLRFPAKNWIPRYWRGGAEVHTANVPHSEVAAGIYLVQ